MGHLVDFNRVDRPIRFGKVGWIVAHEIDARIQAACTGVLRTLWELTLIYLTGPCATEIGIDDDTHIAEVIIDVASTLVIHSRRSKLRWVRGAIRDTRWDRVASEKPCLEVVRGPFSSVDPSSVLIERLSVIVRGGGIVEE